MNKTIYLDPESLKMNFSGTRKKKISNKEPKIKPLYSQTDNNITLAKRKNILKFIRRHQDQNINQKTNDDNNNNNNNNAVEISSDFDESMKYLMDMTDKVDVLPLDVSKSKININTTLKKNPSLSISDTLIPKYGCMKHGGTLPTYRQYQNQRSSEKENPNIPSFEKENQMSLGKISEVPINKKVLKRTFRIGKSLKDQKVSVLVSNKTIRKEISNNDIALKQTSMLDVRRYLVKHGFIKIGTSSPPDVLRQMYESASLMCGNVTNHNSETLMYNFLNSNEKH